MKQQTAVQMLITRLPNIDWTDPYYSDIMKEAVHKEREQILDAFWNGDNSDCLSEENSFEFAEQYYNETYKSE